MASPFTSVADDAALAWLATSSCAVEHVAKMAVDGRAGPNAAHCCEQEDPPCL